MPPFDFRTSQIQTKQIIATGSFDGLGANSQIAIYPIEAEGSPANQGEISAGLLAQLDATDVFLFISGGIGEKDGTNRATTVFGGDIHISGNMTIDGTGGGGGGPFPFRPVAADFGTPIVTGTVTGGVTVTDIAGATLGSVYDYIQITATDPQAGAFVQIPITMPVSPLPDRFELDLVLFTGGPPSDDFQSGLAFGDASGDRFWEIFHQVDVSSTSRPVVKILEIDTFVVGASWDLPDAIIGNGVEVHAAVEKVVPFAAIPQVRFDVTGGSLAVNEAKVSGTAFALNKTSGTISAGWTGEDFVTAQIILVFLSTMVGAVDLFLALEFLPHIKDR